MSHDRNIFADDGEKVDKVIFRPLALDMNQKVKKVSDPPPRPLPPRLDNRPEEEWSPDISKRVDGAEVVESVRRFGNIVKYVLVLSISVGVLLGLAWLIFWILGQYNL